MNKNIPRSVLIIVDSMKRLKKRWYAFTLIGIILALVAMVIYNYMIFNANAIDNMEEDAPITPPDTVQYTEEEP